MTESENSFSLIADFEGNEEQIFQEAIDDNLPILPLRNMVLFPGVVLPVTIGRKSSLKLVKQAMKNHLKYGMTLQEDGAARSKERLNMTSGMPSLM